jgi:TP901 family phage tail tape measure protein
MAGTQVASLFVHLALNNQMTSALRGARGDFDSFHGRVRSGMQTLYTEAIRLAGAVSAIFGAGKVISTFSAFDLNLKNIQAVSKRTDEEMRILGDQILSFAENTIYGGVRGSEAFYQIASAVPDAAKQMAIYKAGLNAAAAGQADLSSTIDFGIATMQSFGFEAEQAQYVFDVLSQTVRYGRSSMDALSAAMAPTANLVATIGVNLEEWGAGVSYMDALGATAGVAATRFQRMIISLLNPNATMEGIFGKLGVEGGFELIERNAGSLAGAYLEIMDAIGGDKNILMQAVGRQEAYAGALALTEDAFQSYLTTFSSDLMGQSEAMLAVQMESLTYQFERFRAQIEGVTIRLGAFLAPALAGIIGFFSNLINMLNEANPAILPFVAGMTLLLVTLIPLLPILRAVGGALLIMAGPVVLVGTLIASAASVLERNLFGITDTIRNFFYTVNQAIRPFTEMIRIAFLNLFSEERGSLGDRIRFFFSSSLPDIFRAGLNVLGSVVSNIGPVLMKVGDVVLSMGIAAARGLGNFIIDGLASLSQLVSGANIRKMLGLGDDGSISPLLERVKLWLDTAILWLGSEGKALFEAAVATALDLLRNLGVWWDLNVNPLVDEVVVWLVGAGNWLQSQEAKDLIGGGLKAAFGFLEGGVTWLESIVPSVTNWIAEAANWIISTGAHLISGALQSAFGVGGEVSPLTEQLDEIRNMTLPGAGDKQGGVFDRIGDALIGNIAAMGRRIVESLQRVLTEEIVLPEWMKTVVDVFLTPLATAFGNLEGINWDNIALAGTTIVGFFFGFRVLRGVLQFTLLTEFLDQLDKFIESIKTGDWGGALLAASIGLTAFFGVFALANLSGTIAVVANLAPQVVAIGTAVWGLVAPAFAALLPWGLLLGALYALHELVKTPAIEEGLKAWEGVFENAGIIIQGVLDKIRGAIQDVIDKVKELLGIMPDETGMRILRQDPAVAATGNPYASEIQGATVNALESLRSGDIGRAVGFAGVAWNYIKESMNRAGGGPVWPGVFRVGEGDKPELLSSSSGLYLIPGERGNVIPSNRLGSGGGDTFVINGDVTIEGARDYDGMLDGIARAARSKNASIVMGRNR